MYPQAWLTETSTWESCMKSGSWKIKIRQGTREGGRAGKSGALSIDLTGFMIWNHTYHVNCRGAYGFGLTMNSTNFLS